MHKCFFFFFCKYVCAPCAYLIPEGVEESIWSPGIGVTDGYKSPCGCWEKNPGTLEKQPALITTKPSLQPILHVFKW